MITAVTASGPPDAAKMAKELRAGKDCKVKLVVESDEEDQELTEYRVESWEGLPDN